MGLFTRKDSASQASSSRPRPSVSSEAQAAELRGRARRRLAGAVALVLAAVIVLPMVLDSEPVPVANDIPIRIPDRNAPYQPQVSPPAVADAGSAATGTMPGDASNQTPATQPPATPPTPPDLSGSVPPPEPATSIAETELSKPPAVTPPPATKPPATPPKAPPAPPKTARDDDGARALALLEGRASAEAPARAAPKPATKGNFVLQIASYGGQTDAQSRRTKLHQAGVTNAFVEEASVGGKQQYRLRVGPFPSREAAQAAQARLRTLGYDNGFITGQ